MTGVVFGGVGVIVLALVVVAAGNRMLRNHTGSGGGMADSLGSFIDVFDPARARADRDLESKENQGEVIPSPDDDERPVDVDLASNRATVRRSVTPPPVAP
jgi:hypothetical protein